MKLQTKLLLTLLSGVLLVTVASQLFQRQSNSAVISRLAQANLALEEKSQWAWVENLQRATQVSLLDAMALGDMDKFTRLLYAQREVQGLQEMTLYNADGVATYSTLTNRLRQKLPADLTEKLLRKTENVVRRTPESFELFRPSRVDKSCLECHNELKEGTTGGVLAMRFTTDSLKEASHQWTGLVDTLASQSLWNMVLTTAVLCVVTAFMIAVAVRRQIAAPLNRITGFLTTSSEQLNGAAAAVATASAQLAGDASHQAASLEETSASLEEMASMTRGNVEHAAKVDALAREAAGTTEGGMKDMEALDQAMQAIQASGTQVAHIVRTIDEIAFQTNILALNAAVEAARAGEAGMGFAVVADEVRNLAQRSAKAAKETANQIEESISRGNLGAQLSVQVHSKLASILGQIRQVTALASEVSSACREQDQGVQQINQAVEQMDRATQGTAAGAEESASASEELRAQASELNQAVNQLQQLINGNQRRPEPAEPTPKRVVPATSAPPPKGSKASLDAARRNGQGQVKAATAAEPHAAELRAGF